MDEDIVKVSIVGAGMIDRPGIAAKMFDTLAKSQINIKMISDTTGYYAPVDAHH